MDAVAGQVIRARSERLVTKAVGDEIVIYDLDTDKAHLLNPASAVLWRLCEQGATVGMLRAALEAELNTNGTTDELLWTALDDLSRAGLLETNTSFVGRPTGMTRRSLLKKAGILAIAAPAITTILAPPAAAATTGETCIKPLLNENTCDGGGCCNGSTCEGGGCCVPKGNSCNGEVCCGGTACISGTCCYSATGTGTDCGGNDNACCGTNVCGTGNLCTACIQNGSVASRPSQCCSGTLGSNGRCVANNN